MILPPGSSGVAFTNAADGDQKEDDDARRSVSERLGIEPLWATVTQVHGNRVVHVTGPGNAGEADGLWTDRHQLPLAVLTADCFGVVLVAPTAVGVAHAGWRGARGAVAAQLSKEMSHAGHRPTTAFVGPGIGACCFEVGPEVAREFPSNLGQTTWGTTSVDLRSVIDGQLGEAWMSHIGGCTMHELTWYSHRRDGAPARMAAIGWLP